MTFIQPSRFLINLFANLTKELTALNTHDPELQKALTQINHALSSTQKDIDGEQLLNLMHHIKELVASYDIKPTNKPAQEGPESLPHLLFNIIEELEHLILKEQVMNKMSLSYKIEQVWNKLAQYHSKSR